jgi:hypothetical protein
MSQISIKPMEADEYKPENLVFEEPFTDSIINLKYNSKLLQSVARNCTIIYLKPLFRNKYLVLINISDQKFIEMIKKLERTILNLSCKNKIFNYNNNTNTIQDYKKILISSLCISQKYGCNIICELDDNKSEFLKIFDKHIDNLNFIREYFMNHNIYKDKIIDIAFNFDKLKYSHHTNNFSININIDQINIITKWNPYLHISLALNNFHNIVMTLLLCNNQISYSLNIYIIIEIISFLRFTCPIYVNSNLSKYLR